MTIFLYGILIVLLVGFGIVFPWVWIIYGILLVIWLINFFSEPTLTRTEILGVLDDETENSDEKSMLEVPDDTQKGTADVWEIPAWMRKKK